MKICLYLKFFHLPGQPMFKDVGTGLITSLQNQKKMLNKLNIPFVEKWDKSCDILQSNTPWPKSIYTMKKAKRQGKKVIIYAHVTVEDGMAVFRFMPLVAPLLKKYYTYAYGQADLVFCPSEYTKSLLIKYGLPEKKLVVQSNAVDLKKFYTNKEKRQLGRMRYNLNGLTIGTMAQVNPRKGVDTFLALAEKFSSNQFIWFGSFMNKLIIKGLPKTLPKNVKFTGYISDVLEGYNAMDIFLFPSYEENQGMAILEAAAVGLPILVRDIPAYNGWLVHNENCLKAKTNEEFVKYLQMLIEDENLRKKLSENALILAKSESTETKALELKKQYDRFLKN